MEDFFFANDQKLWGFRLPHKGNPDIYLNQFTQDNVKKIIDCAFQLGWDMLFLTKMFTPCIYINSPTAILHFFLTEEDAILFRDDIMGEFVSKNYPYSVASVMM